MACLVLYVDVGFQGKLNRISSLVVGLKFSYFSNIVNYATNGLADLKTMVSGTTCEQVRFGEASNLPIAGGT